MQVHLVSDGRQPGRSSPELLSNFGVGPLCPTLFFRPRYHEPNSLHAISMSLRIISTGGTFDKHYDPLSGELIFGASVLPAALKRARITASYVLEPLFALDSLDMQDEHRLHLLKACQRATEDRILIVHGTDTMRETAQVLAHAGLKKTIVLTGAMVPYLTNDSDAMFNLGFAFAAASLSEPGVFIAMNGRVFQWNEVIKNRSAGIFEKTGSGSQP